jgi:hypothetical protein
MYKACACISVAAGCTPADSAGSGGLGQAVLGAMRPGVRWPDMHLLAERALLGGLKAAGCVRGSLDEMMERRLGAVFMPHGGAPPLNKAATRGCLSLVRGAEQHALRGGCSCVAIPCIQHGGKAMGLLTRRPGPPARHRHARRGRLPAGPAAAQHAARAAITAHRTVRFSRVLVTCEHARADSPTKPSQQRTCADDLFTFARRHSIRNLVAHRNMYPCGRGAWQLRLCMSHSCVPVTVFLPCLCVAMHAWCWAGCWRLAW